MPFEGGDFYHVGTTEEMIASAWAIQNRVKDQRFIIQKRVKRHSAVFTQNVVAQHRPDASLNRIWLENCRLGDGWTLHARQVLTGIPTDSWTIDLPEGVCVDVVPVDEAAYGAAVVRHYSAAGYGPGHIRQELQRRGVPRELWEELLSQMPPAEEAAERFIQSKCKGKQLDREMLRKLSAALQRRGFSWQDIGPVLRRLEDEIQE